MTVTAPLVDRSAHKRVLSTNDVYGLSDNGRYLPNPRDWIVDEVTSIIKTVLTVDYALYTYTTEVWDPVLPNEGSNVKGIGDFLSPGMYKFYVDESKSPPSLSLDGRVGFVPFAESIRVFLGDDISETGDIISGYMRSGDLISTEIPMSLAGGLKFPMEGVVTRPILEDNQLLTFVVYNGAGRPIVNERAQLIKTANISRLEDSSREIISVSLESPWLESPTSNLLRLPTNISLDDLQYNAKIQYSDRVERVPVDGVRVRLEGLRNSGAHDNYYIASNVGKEIPLVFSYQLGVNELYTGSDLSGDTIVKDYRAVPEAVDGAYSLKLYVVPNWIGGSIGWELKYYLYDLRRGMSYDATTHIRAVTNSNVFNPKLYNVKQSIIVTVNTREVSQSFKAHQFPQSFDITLLNDGSDVGDNFIIGYLPNSDEYGRGVYATFDYDNISHSTVKLDCGCMSLSEWLNKLYDTIYPLYDRKMEAAPPRPTHFRVNVGNSTITLPVTDWHKAITMDGNIRTGSTLTISWIYSMPSDDLELGMSSMLLYPLQN